MTDDRTSPGSGDDPGPILQGVTVLDFTQYVAGPVCTRMLADLGADVIKVEVAPHGDPQRGGLPRRNKRAGAYLQQNTGKRSICVDLGRPEGIAVIKDLIPHVDVVVENYSAGVMARRGLAYDDLAAVNPAIIMASVTGFGQEGPLSHKTAFDFIAQAYSGLMHVTGDPDGPPTFTGNAVGDVNAGVHAFAGLGYALYQRDRTGRGCHLDVSMVDALFHMQELAVVGPSVDPGFRAVRGGRHYSAASPAGVFKGPEGWIVIFCAPNQIDGLWASMGRPELAEDPRFENGLGRIQNRDALTAEIEEWMAGFATDAEVLEVLESHRVPCAPVVDPATARDLPHFAERGAVRTVADPRLDEVVVPAFPMRFSGAVPAAEGPAPAVGAHNREVLGGILGYDEARIAALEADGVLAAKEH